jgi:fatty-acyl-CoA synthase
MLGLMMETPLSIPAILRRAESLFRHKGIVSRRPDRSLHRYTYGECLTRARRLAAGLRGLGLNDGDRVATFCWNHWRHLEAYYAIPGSGLVLHTLNIRLHPDDLAYIADHAGDSAIIVDKVLYPLFERFRGRISCRHVIVCTDDGDVPEGTIDYEALLAGAPDDGRPFDDLDERSAAIMCYTSGTTGKPKGVVYSHRSLTLHALGCTMSDGLGVRERDVILPVVPLFHANAWGYPFTCALAGASQVHPGPHLDPASLLELFAGERVTITAGVPTIWLGILQTLDANPGAHDLSSLHTMVVGGAAAPESMIRGFQERHGLHVLHAWGMTETSPLGSVSYVPSWVADAGTDEVYAARARQGYPAANVEIRARDENGLVPWDGATMGELEVRGPWVARAYYNPEPEAASQFTDDGWFRTGDIVTIDPHGCLTIQDRAKDLIKSGGEWISSVAVESALMGHPSVAEAVVVAAPHPRWGERPVAAVVLKPGQALDTDALRAHLEARFAKWWVPDAFVAVPNIPRTSAGKFLKSAVREQFRTLLEAPVDAQATPAAQEARSPVA